MNVMQLMNGLTKFDVGDVAMFATEKPVIFNKVLELMQAADEVARQTEAYNPHVKWSAPKKNVMKVGATVTFNDTVSPKYMVGVKAKVVKVNQKSVKVTLMNPVGRFSTRPIRVPLSLIA